MTPRILVVEDESAIRDMVSFALRRAGMDAITVPDVPAAQHAIAEKLPDLILLDWMLPGTSGLEYARRLKRDELTRETPIIMLTARSEEDDRVMGLDAGLDDYVVKPFSTRELVSRIKAVLRRTAPQIEEMRIEIGDLRIDTASQRVFVRGEHVHLGPTEFKLLLFFMSHPERVYTRGQVLDNVWGTTVYIEERTVDVHIRRLRKALEPYGCEDYIQTVRGSGYRFSTLR
ncbi:MAG: phosphate regulon transcriptional regulator PhoB [Xanthomonadales bacterium]|nr:phosphate regulon transcriptional regulator PhoB [Xanthomonadales bacterium]